MMVMTVNPPHVTPAPQARLVSVSQPIDRIAPLRFLRVAAGADEQRIFWQQADADYVFAGYGVAASLTATGPARFQVIHDDMIRLFADAVIETVNEHIRPRLFGGFAFQHDTPLDGLWRAFAPAYFVLPRVLLTQYSGLSWLTVSGCVPPGGEAALRAELDALVRLLESAEDDEDTAEHIHAAAPVVHYPLDQAGWRQQITSATRRMQAGELDKVVLSRTCDVTFGNDKADSVNPLDALERLARPYASSYRFLIEAAPGSAFFGATPELLAEVNGRLLKTVALAGSIRRGTNAAEDDDLAAQLWANPKERYEHGLVVEGLRDLLEPRTHELVIPEVPGVMKLSNIQHLYTPIYGELRAEDGILSLVELLHPTPALGGYPREIAMQTIVQSEIITRGWYASPVGWLDAQGDGMFVVAIRSAVSSGARARLYAGAGIVAASDPDREWDETRLKFRPMLEALSADIH